MAKTKVKAKAKEKDKAPPAPDVQKRPANLEKEDGQQPDVRKAEQLTAAEPGAGTVNRARMMTNMQQSVGNNRLSRLLDTSEQESQETGEQAESSSQSQDLGIQRADKPENGELDRKETETDVQRSPDKGETLQRKQIEKEAEKEPPQTSETDPRQSLAKKKPPPAQTGTGPQRNLEITPKLESLIEANRGKGKPLAGSTRASMESRFGQDLSEVRIHTGREAEELAAAVGAQAFTSGSDIWFGAGQSPEDKKLLAHELTHTAQQRSKKPDGRSRTNVDRGQRAANSQLMRAPGPLTAAEERSAIRYTTSRYDERSVRIIQLITGTGVDGIFGEISAQAVATWQGPRGLAVDGKVGPNTLNQMVPNRAGVGRHEHAIQLVVDFHNLDVTSDTLSVHFDATLAGAGATNFESGNLRVIRIGPPAFASAATLRAAIAAQLAVAAPAVPALGPRPTHLSRADEVAAIRFNRRRFSDGRSVRAIQGHVGANPDGIWGPDTVQRIAEAQHNAGLTVDGKVGEQTLERFVVDLIAAGQQNAAIRMIVDFFNIRDQGNLLDIFFDPTVASNASTDFRPDEPVRVRIGPSGLAQPFAGIVHTIAHELEHVRRLREGIRDRHTHEFLGEAIEILSVDMPEEQVENIPNPPAGAAPPGHIFAFANDATRALSNWNLMPLADQRRFRARFSAVRQRVRDRIAAGTPVQQAAHAGLVANYNAVVLPPP